MKERSRYITLPEYWDELTEADWQQLLKMRQQVIDQRLQVTAGDVRIETARMLLKNRGVKDQTGNPNWLKLVSDLSKTLGWLWKEQDGGLSLVYRSTGNLLPRVGEWTGPLSHGEDLTFGEFREALQHCQHYEDGQNQTALAALAGLLYRPKATPRQQHEQQLLRQPYDWDTLDSQIKRGRQMEPWQQWGIYAWFAYFAEYLTTGTFNIGGEEVSFAPIFESNGRQGDSRGSLLEVGITMAESRVFGTQKEVDHTPLLRVMLKLLMDYRSLEKLKKKH